MSKERKDIDRLYKLVRSTQDTLSGLVVQVGNILKTQTSAEQTFVRHDKEEMKKFDIVTVNMDKFTSSLQEVSNKLDLVAQSNQQIDKTQQKKIKKLSKRQSRNEKEVQSLKVFQIKLMAYFTAFLFVVAIVSWIVENNQKIGYKIEKNERYNQLDYERWKQSQKK